MGGVCIVVRRRQVGQQRETDCYSAGARSPASQRHGCSCISEHYEFFPGRAEDYICGGGNIPQRKIGRVTVDSMLSDGIEKWSGPTRAPT